MNAREARIFYKEVLPLLSSDRPQIVFDMSRMRHVDSVGVAVLVRCICLVMKYDGDIRLAAVLPQAAAILELTRIGRLFEMYENPIAAVGSFSNPFSACALQPFYPHLAALAVPLEPTAENDGVELAA